VSKSREFLGKTLRAASQWLGDQPIVSLFTAPSRLRSADREQAIALATIPLLAVGLVVGGGVAAATLPDRIQVDLDGQAQTPVDQQSALADSMELPIEPETYHSSAQYLANLEEYRQAIRDVKVSDDFQRKRSTEVLRWLEVRDWEFVGELDDEVCFRHDDRVECVEAEGFDALRTAGQSFAAAHPRGIGLCYDWFDDVCMSGEWFDSREVFEIAIANTALYVVTGTQPTLEDSPKLEDSPTYEATRAATITDPDFFSATAWEEITQVLFPNRSSSDLRVTPNDRGAGFCIGSAFDGDCFESREALNKAMSELSQAYREGTCSGWATGNNGVSVCTAIWVGQYPNHSSLSLGEAVCDNNTGTCELIPSTNRKCLYNCSLAPTPSGPVDNSQRTCFWECEVVDCATYDRWVATGTGPIPGENWPLCNGDRVCSWAGARLDCAEYESRLEWERQNGRPWGT